MAAYVSQLTAHFGSATTVGSLHGIKATDNSGKFKRCTSDGRRVHQVYQDDEGVIYELDDLELGKPKEDGTIQVLSADEIAGAKESKLPENVINITAHDKNEINDYIYPSGNQAYVFKPEIRKGKKVISDPINEQWYDFINTILRDTDVALLGMCNLRGNEGLFRLNQYQGYITLQKQLYPEELNRFDERSSSLELPARNKATEISRKAVKDFEPKVYENNVKKRLAKLDSTGMSKMGRKVETSSAQEVEFSMISALEEFTV